MVVPSITIALLSDIVVRSISEAIQEYGLLTGLEKDLSALERTFKQIQGVLVDAENKQTTLKGVEEWLRTLRSASLEVENVLDEAKTQAMIQSLRREMGKRYKIRDFFSYHRNPSKVKFKIAHKLKNLRKKLEEIDANRSRFQLTPIDVSEDAVGIGGKISYTETSSLGSKIYGRDEEKIMLIDKICNQDIGIRHGHDDVRVYAIWGMGGIGKTTLAQYVYNHETVKTSFELMFWVHVSHSFDIRRIIKSICGSEVEDADLNTMLVCLTNKLREKKFFLVMDDVWIENKQMKEWDELCKALNCGAKGSTVMVTARKEDTAQLMAKIPELQHNVAHLSKEESWSLFKMLAFPVEGEGGNVKELELVGRKIVEKCNGLPLAVKTLGSLMSTKKKVNEWQLVNDKFMSEMQEHGILTALRLSYDDLPPYMKICFAYCCVFSKGEEMSKDLMIELWMANEFIPSKGDVSMLYELGEEIFTCLVRRSFFQDVVEENIHKGETCKMHDLMHDLAHYVMSNDCAVKETGKKLIIPDEALHFRLSYGDFQFTEFAEFAEQDLRRLRSLRSMLVLNDDYRSSLRQISNLGYLRVLYLNRIKSLTLPESICKLIHLRYLKIERSDIEVLPDSIIYLQNLQTLILEWCLNFRELPRHLRYMRNLQRLDTDYSALSHMPVGIEKLKNLRRLSHFYVGESEGARIGELGNLNLLGRELTLSRLYNVGGLSDAKSAKLKDKTNLRALTLSWSQYRTSDSEVVEGLEPNSDLQELFLFYYTGLVIVN
ncbi:Disease resistance protein [Artemisia annua]|uniref:Disease resistance protein n=1 Tax=Artemisia annua TaxID=35608 RepID=A0A2U1MTF2_ARTAN|nr:Disease resistance protein [Artemisia annua]